MSEHDASRVRLILSRRGEFLQLVVVAALLALGVNILSDWVLAVPIVKRHVGVVGAAIIALALAWLLLVAFRERSAQFDIEAAFLFDTKANEIVEIPEYEFGESVARTVKAVLAENKAFAEMWKRDPLLLPQHGGDQDDAYGEADIHSGEMEHGKHAGEGRRGDTGVVKTQGRESKTVQLFREVLEYELLEALSLHLSDYFNEYRDEDKYIRRYERDDIPHLLLQNRVLGLLSMPYEDRASFGPHASEKPPGKVYAIFAADGAIYSRFELVLPRGTVISRIRSGSIQIKSKRLTVTLSAEYDRFASGTFPFDYARIVLGRENLDLERMHAKFSIQYTIHPLSLLRRSGWQYYQWVDSFAAYVRERFSIDEYLRRVSWDSVHLQSEILLARRDRT